jgi:glycine cleavage system regulatory protein
VAVIANDDVKAVVVVPESADLVLDDVVQMLPVIGIVVVYGIRSDPHVSVMNSETVVVPVVADDSTDCVVVVFTVLESVLLGRSFVA